MSYKTEWDKIGYDLEDLYFEKLNRELIHRMKHPETNGPEHPEELGHLIQFRSKSVTDKPFIHPSLEKKAS